MIFKLWSRYKDIGLFTFSSLAKAFGQLASGLLIIRFIEPKDLGIWHSINLATTYALFMQGGVLNGLSRELPFFLGEGKDQKAQDLASTTNAYTNICSILSIIIGVIALCIYWNESYKIRLAIGAVSITTAFTFYNDYLITTFRSKNSFNKMAYVYLTEASLMILSLPLLYFFQYEGLIFRALIVSGIALFLLHTVRPLPVKLKFKKDDFFLLLHTGIPIFILAYIVSSTSTFDRIFLLKQGGTELVGYYALAMIVFSTFEIIPGSLSQYIYPRMSYEFGKEKNPFHLWKIGMKVSGIIFLIMLPLAVIAWISLPFFVNHFFPKYAHGISAAQIILFGSIFSSLTLVVNSLWSMKKWKYIIIYQITISALQILGPFFGILLFSSPLVGVAVGKVLSLISKGIMSIIISYLALIRSNSATLNPAQAIE